MTANFNPYEQALRQYKFDDYEFGAPMWKGIMWHKLPDGVAVASWQGDRLFEVHPNNDMYIVIGKRHTAGCTNRWSNILSNLDVRGIIYFSTVTTKTAAGLKKTRVSMRQGNGKSQMVYTYGKAKLSFSENNPAFLKLEACKPPVKVVKDKAKYREFNKELKALLEILMLQTRVGAYDNYVPPKYIYGSLKELFATHIGDPVSVGIKDIASTLAKKWIDTKDPALLEPVMHAILLSTFENYRSNHYADVSVKRADYLRRIKLRKKMIQQHYLRTECAKLFDSSGTLSTDDESEDQDRELLENDGLREVQVPCEAEVC